MKLSTHVLSALDNWDLNKKDFSLMDACFAIEGTARNLYKKESANRNDYKKCLREYYWIIEIVSGLGINLKETKFNNLKIKDGKNLISNPDFADVIYHIFRCNFAHCKDIPPNYELTPIKDGGLINWEIGDDLFRIPESIILGLLAVSVFSKVNKHNNTEGVYYLSYKDKRFEIKDWWGREDDVRTILLDLTPNPIVVKLEGLDKY